MGDRADRLLSVSIPIVPIPIVPHVTATLPARGREADTPATDGSPLGGRPCRPGTNSRSAVAFANAHRGGPPRRRRAGYRGHPDPDDRGNTGSGFRKTDPLLGEHPGV